jgi:pyrroline-5-carboxylate reductase
VSISEKLAVIGGGNIGEALLKGLLREDAPLFQPEQIVVVEQNPGRAKYLGELFGVSLVDVADAAEIAGTVLIAVKPHHLDGVVARIAPHVTDDHLIVSVVGGIPTARIEAGLDAKAAVVRCIPNTAIALGEGMTAITAGSYADPGHLRRVRSMFEPVGRVVEVPEEQADTMTALAGSGPAYFFLFAEAMIDAGVLLGLSRPLATEVVNQTAVGAGLLLRDSGTDAVALRAAVSSPGGTTVAAVREFEDRALRAAVMAAATAARDRAVELGR